MEFLKLVRKRSFLSEFVYTILNIALAIALLVIVRYTDAVWLAFVLVLLSKWRIFAVRPRYWWANLQSNLVDIILSTSIVIHLYTVNTSALADGPKFLLLAFITLLYIGWLLFVKPRSKRAFVTAQAGIALFSGLAALFTISYNWPVSIVVIFTWLAGYAAARHTLSTYDDETHSLFLGLIWGLVVAELSWVAYHWAIAYPLPIISSIMVPQIALIAIFVSFLVYKAYDSFYHHDKIRLTDVLLPLLFTVSAIAVLLLVFNRVGTAI